MPDEKKPYALQCPSCAANLPEPGFNGMTTCKFCMQVVKIHEPGTVPRPGTVNPYWGGTASFYPKLTAGTADWFPIGIWTMGT